NFFQRTMISIMWRGHRITSRTTQIATVGYFHNRQTTVLLVVHTKSAIVRTTIIHVRPEMNRRFGSFVVIADVFVIFDIGRQQSFEKTVFGTAFVHPNFFVLNDDFRTYTFQTFGTKTDGVIIISII